MKCNKCGFIPNPGDQICMNCGAKLSADNAIVPGVETIEEKENITQKNNKKIIVAILIGLIVLIFIVLFIALIGR